MSRQKQKATKSALPRFKIQWDLQRYFYDNLDDQKLFDRWSYIKKQIDLLAQRYKKVNFAKYPEKVLEYMEESEKLFVDIGNGGKPLVYVWLLENLNTKDAKIKQVKNRLIQEYINTIAPIQQIDVKINKLPLRTLKRVLRLALADKRYQKYEFAIKNIIKERKHILHPKQEEVLLHLSPITSKWATLTEEWLTQQYIIDNYNKNSNKKAKRLTLSQLNPIFQSSDLEHITFIDQKLAAKYKRAAYMATKEMNALLLDKYTKSKMRKYKDTLEPRLLSARVERATIDALVAQAKQSFSVAHKYYKKLKSRFAQLYGKEVVLGYEHRVALPFGRDSHINNQDSRLQRATTAGKMQREEQGRQRVDSRTWPFANAVSFMTTVLRSVDQEAYSYFADVLNGRVDVYPKPAKTGGAFALGVDNRNIPEFILLNYNNIVDDMFTLAHEFGHAFHSYMAKQHQPYVYWGYPLTVAEFASTFLETIIILMYLLQAPVGSRQELLYKWGLDMVSTVYRQLALFMFEIELHEQFAKYNYLGTKQINTLFKNHMTAYLGPDVEFRRHHQLYWVGWGHIRRPFYVFTYAFGALTAYSLLKDFVEAVLQSLAVGHGGEVLHSHNLKRRQAKAKVTNAGKAAAPTETGDKILPTYILDPLKKAFKRYKIILASGDSDTTENIFSKVGLDISSESFWKDAFKLPELVIGQLLE